LSGVRATRCAVPKNTQTLVVPCDGSPTGGNRLAAKRPDFEAPLTESKHMDTLGLASEKTNAKIEGTKKPNIDGARRDNAGSE